MTSRNKHKRLEDKIQYIFDDSQILSRALTHRSHSPENYERLEFLGDAVLDMVLSEKLYNHFTEIEEGRLSRIRAHLVNQKALAEIARSIELDSHLILGKGEKTMGKNRDSILSDSLEAILGGVYIDGWFESVKLVIENLFDNVIGKLIPTIFLKTLKAHFKKHCKKIT